MKSEKAVMPMRSVNANPGKYVSIITNFGCHYTCPECIVRNNGLKMSETDDFSTQEPLNKVLCKERPEWVSVSGGGDPLFHWKDHWSFYEGLFHTAERRNVKLEMHTSYLPDSPDRSRKAHKWLYFPLQAYPCGFLFPAPVRHPTQLSTTYRQFGVKVV